jgi:hypothetical protein
LFIGSPRVTHYSRTAATRPAAPDASIVRYDYHDLYLVACTARQPPAVPGLINRRLIRAACYVKNVVHKLLVIPAGWKLGLAGIAHSMAVATSAIRVAVKNVCGAFRSDAERVQRRTFPGIYRVPAGTILLCVGWCAVVVTPIDRPAVGGAERLVALGAGSQLSWLGPGRRSVTGRSIMPPMLLRLDVVGLVQSVVVPV